jgi:hypothetical protein
LRRGIVGAQRQGGIEQLTAVGRLDLSVSNPSSEALGFVPDVLHVAVHDADPHDVDVVKQPVVLRVKQSERAVALHRLQRQPDEVRELLRLHWLPHGTSVGLGAVDGPLL